MTYRICTRIVAVGVIFAAMFHVLPWWFTLLVGIPLLIDACVMLHRTLIEPAARGKP